MYAIMKDGTQQVKVENNQVLNVAYRKDLKEGDKLLFDQVNLLNTGTDIKIGTPLVSGAKVNAVVLKHGREKKVVKFMFKRRKSSKLKQGHRQYFTRIQITSIEG